MRHLKFVEDDPDISVTRAWTEIEVDGEKYRWAAMRKEKATDEGLKQPVVMILVDKVVAFPDGTEPTQELAVDAIRRMRSES